MIPLNKITQNSKGCFQRPEMMCTHCRKKWRNDVLLNTHLLVLAVSNSILFHTANSQPFSIYSPITALPNREHLQRMFLDPYSVNLAHACRRYSTLADVLSSSRLLLDLIPSL
jgi:hypothetical protein